MIADELAPQVELLDVVRAWRRDASSDLRQALDGRDPDGTRRVEAANLLPHFAALLSGIDTNRLDVGGEQEALARLLDTNPLARETIGRSAQAIVADGPLVQRIAAQWRESVPPSMANRADRQGSPRDQFLAAELTLLVDLGVPVAQAWRVATTVLPASRGAAMSLVTARAFTQSSEAAPTMSRLTLLPGIDLAGVAARLNTLALEDPDDPAWRKRVARCLSSPVVRVSAGIMEKSNGLVGDQGSMASILIAAMRSSLDALADEDVPEAVGYRLLESLVTLIT